MNQTQLTQVALKIIGIFAIIQSIPILGSFFQTLSILDLKSTSKSLMIIGAIVPFILMAVSGLCLIVFGNKLAEKMFPQISQDTEMGGISSKELQAIAFSVVGILLMLFAIPHFAALIWNYHVITNAGDEMPLKSILENNRNYIIRTVVQFLLGFFLFIGSAAVSALWTFVVKKIQFERKM